MIHLVDTISLVRTGLIGAYSARHFCPWHIEVEADRRQELHARIRSYIRALRIMRAVESGTHVVVPLRMDTPIIRGRVLGGPIHGAIVESNDA